ncbi:hypothetical protein BDZ91DRAFT_780632 [Kalaharituber pfeilii]|nr:hypothetical protein BDZ91DRAFT_780632 [Kalaharituber pfeilii]
MNSNSTNQFYGLDLINRLISENASPVSEVFRIDNRAQANILLKVSGSGLIEALMELESLVKIQTNTEDKSELRWWSWIASLQMAGLFEDSEGLSLMEVRKQLEEVAWRVKFLFKVLSKSNVERILTRSSYILDTLNTVVLNHQWLYFPASRDDLKNDNINVRTATQTLYSDLRARFVDPRTSDAISEYSVTTTTTTRERINRNQSALEIDAMIRKFQETAAGGKSIGYTAAVPDPAELSWRSKPESAVLVLMHWVYEARAGLEPFLQFQYHSPQQETCNRLPVPGYVNLIKSAWLLQTLDPNGALGTPLGHEGKALFALLACEIIDLFQAIHEREFDLPSEEATLEQGDFSITVETFPKGDGQRTPTRSYATQGLSGEFEHSGPVPVNNHLVFGVDNNASSGSSSSTSGTCQGTINNNNTTAIFENASRRGRSAGPKPTNSSEQNTISRARSSSARGTSTGRATEGRGRSRHWRALSSTFTGSGDRERRPSNAHLADSPQLPEQHSGIALRRPSTAASTSSARTTGSFQTFSKVWAQFSSPAPGRGSLSSRPRSRSSSPGRSNPTQTTQAPSSPSRNPVVSPPQQNHSNSNTAGNISVGDAPSPTSPVSFRSHRFPKLQFPASRDRDRTRSGLMSSSLVSLGSAVAEAFVDKTKGVYPTKPVPPAHPSPVQAPTGGDVAEGDNQGGCGDLGRAAEGRAESAACAWTESWRMEAGSGSTPCKSREGEVEIMVKDMNSMVVMVSRSGDLAEPTARWDDCRIRIFAKPEPGQNGSLGTGIRLVTVGMDGSVDQRSFFFEHCELVPEYILHECLPVIYLRKIASSRASSVRTARQQAQQHPQQPATAVQTHSGGSAACRPADTEWHDCSLLYRFKTLQDMFTFQLAFLGERVTTDICSIPTIRYKRTLLDGEHTRYRARVQIWWENSEPAINTIPEVHAYNLTLPSPGSPRTPPSPSHSDGNNTATPPTKANAARIVIFWENGGVVLFLTDSIELENRPCRPSNVANSIHITEPPVTNYVLRLKPSMHFSKPFMNAGCIKARLLSPLTAPVSSFRLDKQGLRLEDCENNADGWEEYRWFEIEFRTESEMEDFSQGFRRWLNGRRKERRKRGDTHRSSSKKGAPLGNKASSSSRS